MTVAECKGMLKGLRTQAGYSIFDQAIRELNRERLKVEHPEKRDRLSPSQKAKLYSKQEGLCARCMNQFPPRQLTDDHTVALAQGGSNRMGNRRLLCAKCQAEKGSADLITESKRGHGTIMDQLRSSPRRGKFITGE